MVRLMASFRGQFTRFSLGRLHMWGGGGQVQGDKVSMGGLIRGDTNLMGRLNFDRLCHKLKVVIVKLNYMMQFISYDFIKTR